MGKHEGDQFLISAGLEKTLAERWAEILKDEPHKKPAFKKQPVEKRPEGMVGRPKRTELANRILAFLAENPRSPCGDVRTAVGESYQNAFYQLRNLVAEGAVKSGPVPSTVLRTGGSVTGYWLNTTKGRTIYANDPLSDPDARRVLAAVNGGARFAREVQRATGLTVAKCRDRLEALARQGHLQRGKVKRAGREWWPVEKGAGE